MNALTYNLIAGLLVASVLFGLRLMNKVPTAVKGNLFCASAMGLAILVTMFKDGSMTSPTLWLAILSAGCDSPRPQLLNQWLMCGSGLGRDDWSSYREQARSYNQRSCLKTEYY